MPIIPLPPVDHALKLEVKGTTNAGFNWANIYHWAFIGPYPTAVQLGDWLSSAVGVWGAFVSHMQHSDITLTEMVATDLSLGTGAQAVYLTDTPGTRAGTMLPSSAAAVVSKSITARYRGGRPRNYYVAGVTADLQDDAHWTDGFVADMTSAYQQWSGGNSGAALGGGTAVLDEIAVCYQGHFGPPPQPEYIGLTNRLLSPLTFAIDVDISGADKELGSQRGRIGRRR